MRPKKPKKSHFTKISHSFQKCPFEKTISGYYTDDIFLFHVMSQGRGGTYKEIACTPPPGVTVISNNQFNPSSAKNSDTWRPTIFEVT
jgi:hypothetical protein